jgi:hypothetical protein
VLFNVYRSLKEGGVFIIDMNGREVLARILQPRDWQELQGTFLLVERRVERSWTLMRNRRILIKDNKRTEFEITHWLYSGAEFVEMLKESGFKSVELYGALDESSYDQAAKRLVAVARKLSQHYCTCKWLGFIDDIWLHTPSLADLNGLH